MDNVFERVTVRDMAMARDRRYEAQRELLKKYNLPLISFTMNIAGDIKTSPLIRAGFREGLKRIMFAIKTLRADVICEVDLCGKTGFEKILCVTANADDIKTAMVRIEEFDDIGRLFDIDVIGENGVKLERNAPRKCLVCLGDVRICARSRAHDAKELFNKAQSILRAHFETTATRRIAACAQRALLYELLVTPKPGLVDRANNGAHDDMDVFTFADSASVLASYFEACAREGIKAASPDEIMPKLRSLGLEAERQMLIVTKGVNTHKGAIFSLGILSCAAGVLLGDGKNAAPKDVCEAAKGIACDSVKAEIELLNKKKPETAGEKMLRDTGMTGARGEAMRGFPTALEAYEIIQNAVGRGESLNDAGVEALLYLITQAEDSNFVKRASSEKRREYISKIESMTGDVISRANELDSIFIRENISPGGSADLLAAAFFMRFVEDLGSIAPLFAL